MCCWTCRWTMRVWRQGRGVRNVSSGSLALAKGLRVATLDQRVINQGLPRSQGTASMAATAGQRCCSTMRRSRCYGVNSFQCPSETTSTFPSVTLMAV
jgi:hypothetical protein